ncbi:hypothetical protein BH09BAC1_BH09BAC1_22960 [soil metagenome]
MGKIFYELSDEADLDLEKIFDYTQEEFGFDQAVRYFERLEGILQQLIINPQLGRARPEIKSGLRSFPEGAHTIYYRILLL